MLAARERLAFGIGLWLFGMLAKCYQIRLGFSANRMSSRRDAPAGRLYGFGFLEMALANAYYGVDMIGHDHEFVEGDIWTDAFCSFPFFLNNHTQRDKRIFSWMISPKKVSFSPVHVVMKYQAGSL